MLQLDIATIAMDPRTDQPVLFMKPHRSPLNEGKILPIALGHPEATAIMVALQGVQMPRPMTHDLLASITETLGIRLARVEISDYNRGTFFAVLTLTMNGETFSVDARPSDAIALAVRLKAPVFIADEVFAAASVAESSVNLQLMRPDAVDGGALMGRTHRKKHDLTPEQAAQARADQSQFKEFLDNIKPDDFS